MKNMAASFHPPPSSTLSASLKTMNSANFALDEMDSHSDSDSDSECKHRI
jgi:hypothetical protein